MRHCLLLIVLLALACWLSTTIHLAPLTRGGGTSHERVVGWRRTEFGWEEASRWQLDTLPFSLPTPAAAVHPLVIASLELMISVGALVAGSPSLRSERR